MSVPNENKYVNDAVEDDEDDDGVVLCFSFECTSRLLCHKPKNWQLDLWMICEWRWVIVGSKSCWEEES